METNITKNEIVEMCFIELIKPKENLVLYPYFATRKEKEKNIATIGYGSCFYEDGRRVQITDAPITNERALDLVKAILFESLDRMLSLITQEVSKKLTKLQLVGMLSFYYNIGHGRFKESSFLQSLNSNDFETASKNFLKYRFQDGKIMPGLRVRRLREKKFFDNLYTPRRGRNSK